MDNMMESEQINELATALAKVQGSIEHASKDSVNPFHKSKYADLASVWEACRKQLSSNGLSIVQLPNGLEDNCLILDTKLLHSSGQWISSRIKMPLSKLDPQGYGSTLTYARRYALAAIVGVYQDDDDSESGTKRTPQTDSKQQKTHTDTNMPTATEKTTTTQPAKSQEQSAKVSEGQVKSLYIKSTKEGLTHDDVHMLIKWKYKIESAKDLTVSEFVNIANNLSKLWAEFVAEQSK
jgi:hypothetical protein